MKEPPALYEPGFVLWHGECPLGSGMSADMVLTNNIEPVSI